MPGGCQGVSCVACYYFSVLMWILYWTALPGMQIIILTKNYRKNILKENINDRCRSQSHISETIQLISEGCKILAPTRYLQKHDQVAGILSVL